MVSISANTANNPNVQSLLDPKKDVNNKDDKTAATSAPGDAKATPGVVVTISLDGVRASAATKNPNQDIDDSGLPAAVKETLKMIRELKKQIAAKQAELQAVMADKNLSPDQARAKINALQSELATLQSGLMTAETSLIKQMKGMSADAAMKTASLLAK
ncbi:MAG: hypothetical protein GAK32_02287 [Pseudomonas fluorescens]|nr:MAG: hypothetical protein GAK32_02287 [Pseudomonas fluorescens]